MTYQRKYDFQPGTKISSSQVDEEFDNLIAAANALETGVNNRYTKDETTSLFSKKATFNLGTSGWFKDDASGLIFQWGTIPVSPGDGGTVVFPIAFPNQQVNVQAIPNDSFFANIIIDTTSKANFHIKQSHSSDLHVYWFAMGY